MAAWLSSTGISHQDLLPHIPSTLSLCSQQQPLPWDCSTIPKLQLPATAPSRGSTSLSGVCMGAARTVWFSVHLGCRRSVVSLSALNVSPLTQIIAPVWGSDPCFCSPLTKGRSSPTNTPVFPPSSFILPSFAWFYIFFSTGQVFPVCCQLVVCMHFWVWRCIPDVSLERDVLHIYLLLCCLVLPTCSFIIFMTEYQKLSSWLYGHKAGE